MIDYFALLDQPRAPWLDPVRLKEKYHEKTLRTHPDTQTDRRTADNPADSFARLNEAYQVLQDPKRRLHYLLSLEGCAPSPGDQTIPSQLQDLFPRVATVTERGHALLEKLDRASNSLSRSLLKTQILDVESETKKVRQEIQDLSDTSLAEMCEINIAWAKNSAEQIEAVSNLYFAFAYLTRWSEQLDEMTFRLSLQ
ncbi:MAG TPA: DnaJ domain-containing protein [Chthoniobacterales bacterium]